jgi:hypothetical protein
MVKATPSAFKSCWDAKHNRVTNGLSVPAAATSRANRLSNSPRSVLTPALFHAGQRVRALGEISRLQPLIAQVFTACASSRLV